MMWDTRADELLISLWDEGGSLAYVADGMQRAGYAVSRNSVAGRKHRLKGTEFKRTSKVPTKVIAVRKRSPRPRRQNVTNLPTRRPLTAEEASAASLHEGVEYLDQTKFGCKAIMPSRGGPWKLQRVCGKPRSVDYNGSMSSYCLTHLRLFTHPTARKV